MKNWADPGGCYPRWIIPSEMCLILHIVRKPNSLISLLFIQNNSLLKNIAKTCLPASMLSSPVAGCTFDVISSLNTKYLQIWSSVTGYCELCVCFNYSQSELTTCFEWIIIVIYPPLYWKHLSILELERRYSNARENCLPLRRQRACFSPFATVSRSKRGCS